MKSIVLADEYLNLTNITSELEFVSSVHRILSITDNSYICHKIINHKFFTSLLWPYIPHKYVNLELLLSINPLDDITFNRKFEFFTLPKNLLTQKNLKKLVQHDYHYVINIPNKYKTPDICEMAVTRSGMMLQYVPAILQTNELIREACANIENLKYAAPNILSNQDIIEIIVKNTIEQKLNTKINLSVIPAYYHSKQIVKLLIAHDFTNTSKTITAHKEPSEYVDWITLDCFFDALEDHGIKTISKTSVTSELLHEHIVNKIKDIYPDLVSAIKIGIRGEMLSNMAKHVLCHDNIKTTPYPLPLFD